MKKIIYVVFMTMFVSMPYLQAKSNEIEKTIKEYEVSLNAGNTDAIMKLYAKNPIFMLQHAPAQIGREAVKNAYNNVFKNINLDIKFSIYEVEVHGDTAWVRTSSAGIVTVLANNKSSEEGNNELFIFKKENNKWKIHRYLFSTSKPRQH